jgi:hypothetical protein
MSETLHFTVLDDLTEHVRGELGEKVLIKSGNQTQTELCDQGCKNHQ